MALDASKFKYLPKILPANELRIFNSLLAVFILSFCALVVSVFFNITNAAPKAGGEYTEGLVGNPRLINPLYSENNSPDRDLVKLTYAGLIRFDGQSLVPDLAESWTLSPDQKEYTFTLRPDIKWGDNEDFNSADVVFTIKTIQDPKFQSSLAANFNGIKVEAPGDLTVKFTLNKPLTPFLESLSVGILPEHIWSRIPPESISLTDFNIQPLGLGPFKFKKLVKDKFGTIRSYTLEPNENYHDNPPYIKSLTFRFYDNINQAIEGLQSKEVEGLSFLPQGLLKDTKLGSVKLHSLQLPQYTAVFFNTSASSRVADKNLRKALALAINKQEILDKAVNGKGRIIDGPILPGYAGYHENIEKFNFDPAAAGALLDEAGWFMSDNNIRENEDDEKLELTLTTANTPELTKAAEIIQRLWSEIGVQVSLNIVDTAAIQGSVISTRRFDVLLFGEIVGLDPDPYPFWHSSQISSSGLNLSNFKHSEADQVLEEARETPDQKKKAEKYIHFQNILVAEVPAIFLYNPDYLYPVSDKIKGIGGKRIINPSDRLAGINHWYIKVTRAFKTFDK